MLFWDTSTCRNLVCSYIRASVSIWGASVRLRIKLSLTNRRRYVHAERLLYILVPFVPTQCSVVSWSGWFLLSLLPCVP